MSILRAKMSFRCKNFDAISSTVLQSGKGAVAKFLTVVIFVHFKLDLHIQIKFSSF